MSSKSRLLLPLTLAVITLLQTTTVVSAENLPDFNGVWVAIASEPQMFRGQPSPLTEQGQAAVDEYFSQYETWVEPGAYCVPPGMPSTMTSMVAYPIEMILSENKFTMLAELEMQVRRIYIDGRDHPDNYPTTRMGYSVGHWEGDTLVIETKLLNEWLTRNWPRTENTEITERISVIPREQMPVEPSAFLVPDPIDNDIMIVDITVNDEQLYKGPQNVIMYYMRIPDDSILEYDCPVQTWQQALDAAQ